MLWLKEFLLVFVEKVLLYFAPILASLATAWLLAKVRQAWVEFKEVHTGESWVVEQIATIAVKAAEQIDLAGDLDSKKDYAVAVAMEWLKARGLKIDLSVIDAAIEAAVFDEFNKPE
jgi:hypothetical protein